MKNKVLITGGAGFIGSHLVEDLLEMGKEVVVLDDFSGGFMDNLDDRLEFVNGSITDVKMVDDLFEKNNFEVVYHLAAYAAEGLSHFIRNFNYTNNLIGSVNLINASVRSKVKCFVFTSSIAVYGSGQVPYTEETIPCPEDPYGIAKLAVEMDLKAACEMFDLNYVVFRPHNVYGERQNLGDKYRNVIGIFFNQILQNKPLTLFGDGLQQRAFTYVKDITPVIAQSGYKQNVYGEVFNVGSDRPYTVGDLADYVISISNSLVGKKYLSARNEVVVAYSSHKKVEKFFGVQLETPLEKGLNTMWEWVTKHGSRVSSEFENIEITEKLPDGW